MALGKPRCQHMRVYLAFTILRLLRNHAHIVAKSKTRTSTSFAAAGGRPRLLAAALGRPLVEDVPLDGVLQDEAPLAAVALTL